MNNLSDLQMVKVYYAIGLGIVITVVTVAILFVKWENKHATKKHNRDFEKFKKEYEEKSRRTTAKIHQKMPEYVSAL